MPRQPMNKAQQRILVVSLLLIILAAALFLVFSDNKPRLPAQVTATPEATFSTLEEAQKNLPTPTPSPSPTPTATPVALATATPAPSPVPTADTVTSLKKGSKGTEVVRLQARLIELYYLPAGQNDGDFGSGTEAAVKDFQRINNLKEDGIAGQQTLTTLYSQEAKGKE